MHRSVLVFRDFRYLKLTVVLVLAAIVAYLLHRPFGAANGGTWLGYTLGTIGALLIVWLGWFGIRKRRYGVGKLLLEDWLSAHVYLGLGLLVIATLHTGFQFGWNVHTLAYALMVLVIASGAFGLFAYVRYPRLMTENRGGLTLGEIMTNIAELDGQCRDVGMKLGDEINAAVLRAAGETRIGGGVWRQLSGTDPNCATSRALALVQEGTRDLTGDAANAANRLMTLLSRKVELLARARRDVRYKALMDIWLYVHVPLTIALLAALFTHVVSVFFYW
ncbi:MAG: hypothetical protein ACE5JZ_00985 [Kiloniellales bacterium]